MEGKHTARAAVEERAAVSGEAAVELLGRPAWPAGDSLQGGQALVDAVEIVADAVARARAAAQVKGVGVAYAYAAQPVWVGTARDRVREAVDLLLDAALESTPAGSIAVRCTRRDGGGLLDVVVVPDPGVTGIDLGAVFADSFEAAPAGTVPARELDLDAVRSLVDERRGGTRVALSPDGDRVTVRLPPTQG